MQPVFHETLAGLLPARSFTLRDFVLVMREGQVFPAEMQIEGAGWQQAGQRFVKYWLHGAHLLVEGKKMSKSLGNFFTLRDLTAMGYSGREIRFLLLSAHYRETFNFTLQGLDGARSALRRIDECVSKLREAEKQGDWSSASEDARQVGVFREMLDDDLNISGAWAVVFDWIRELNKQLAQGEITPVMPT